jgi:hypothetical protein
MDEREDSGPGEKESEDSFELGELEEPTAAEVGRKNRFGGPQHGEHSQVFLKRWRRRAASRRIRLIEELLLSPLGPRRVQKLELLLSSLEGRKAWLQARYEHVVCLENIVKAAVQRNSRNRQRKWQNEFRATGRVAGGYEGRRRP